MEELEAICHVLIYGFEGAQLAVIHRAHLTKQRVENAAVEAEVQRDPVKDSLAQQLTKEVK